MTHLVPRAAARAVAVLLGLLDRFLQLVVPPRRRHVCYFSVPDYTDNAYYLFRHAIRTRDDLHHVWLVRDPAVADRIEQDFRDICRAHDRDGHSLEVVPKNTIRGYLAALSSRVTFHTHGLYSFARSALRREVVCLWHGVGIKAIDQLNRTHPDPKRPFGTTHIATSHFYKYIIACATGVDAGAVRVCGNPRSDALVFEEARATDGDRVRELLHLPPGRQLILWLPTFRVRHDPWEATTGPRARTPGTVGSARPRSFLDNLPEWALGALDDACRQHDCDIVIKLHPLDSMNESPDQLDHEHVRLLTARGVAEQGIQLYDIIAEAHGLVSDLSSVVVDYLVTGRPIGLIAVDPDAHDHDLLFPPELLLDNEPFRSLDGPQAVDAFVRDVAAVRERPGGHAGARDGIAPLLYERFPGPSADLVLREVGL